MRVISLSGYRIGMHVQAIACCGSARVWSRVAVVVPKRAKPVGKSKPLIHEDIPVTRRQQGPDWPADAVVGFFKKDAHRFRVIQFGQKHEQVAHGVRIQRTPDHEPITEKPCLKGLDDGGFVRRQLTIASTSHILSSNASNLLHANR
jgi:hypothetical protein